MPIAVDPAILQQSAARRDASMAMGRNGPGADPAGMEAHEAMMRERLGRPARDPNATAPPPPAGDPRLGMKSQMTPEQLAAITRQAPQGGPPGGMAPQTGSRPVPPGGGLAAQGFRPRPAPGALPQAGMPGGGMSELGAQAPRQPMGGGMNMVKPQSGQFGQMTKQPYGRGQFDAAGGGNYRRGGSQ